MIGSKTLKSLVLSFLVLVPSSAHALGTVEARADVPSEVYLDGQLMGTTPLDIQAIQPGTHEIRVQPLDRDDVRAYTVSVPYGGAIAVTPIISTFGPQVIQPVVVQQAVCAPVIPAVVVRPRPVVLRPVVVTRPVVVVGGRGRGRGWRGRGRRF